MEETYKKSKGCAGQKGVQFQLDLVAVCLLNALRSHRNWKISSENPMAGKYDDIVVEMAGETAVLIQAKHKETKRITKDQLLSDNSKHTDFSLPKYFFSYEEVKSKFPTRTVIICTNAAINTKGLEDNITLQQVQSDSVLYHEGDCSFYTFNENILPELKETSETYLRNNPRASGVDKTMVTDDNLKDFIKNLQIFCCYPCEDFLHEIIEKSLSRLSCSHLCHNISSQEILRKVEDWFQQPKGEYLTEARAKAMLCEIRSDKYCEFLKDFNVSFNDNNLDVAEWKKIIHVNTAEGHLVQILKIYHALHGDTRRKLYVNPDDAMEAQKDTVEAFGLRRYTFLITALTAIKNEIVQEEIICKLKGILLKNEYKKVVLVADPEAGLAQQFGADDISHVDGSTAFQDLSQDSQQMLWKRHNIVFQGETVTLQELLHTQTAGDYTKSLHSAMLEQLVKGNEIRVGARPLDLDEDTARYYVSRRFQTKTARQPRATRDIDIITEETLYDVNENIIAISDSAGMGKTTVLTNMAVNLKRNNPSLWVIKINLNDYASTLRDLVKAKRNEITAAELLNSLEATRMTSEFEKLVFSMSRKVVLLLDGVDEVSPDYTDLVLSLIGHCQKAPNFAKIFVTTRPHVDLKLTDVGQFQMLPLSELEQIGFLTDYWMYNLNLSYENKEKCKRYATLLIGTISSWTKFTHWRNHFTDVPLQVRMLAEIFQQNTKERESTDWEGCREYLQRDGTELKLPKKFNIAELYDAFIGKKRDVFVEKGNSGGSATATPALLTKFESCLAYHRSLAVSTIVPVYKQRFKIQVPEDKDTEEYILKIGIVQRLDNRIQFIHRTFAEYFLASCIVQELRLKNPDPYFQRLVIDEILLKDKYEIVRAFLEIIPQIVSLPPKIFKQYRSMIRKEPNSKLVFRLAKEGHVAILRLVLESVKFKVVKGRSVDVTDWRLRIPFRKRNTLNDLAVLVRRAGVNITDGNRSLLELAVTEGHLEMVNFLIQRGADVNVRDHEGNPLMHIAALRGALEIVRCLLDHGLDVNVMNSGIGTALHMTTGYGYRETVEYLLKHGADVNSKNKRGLTALHVAAKFNKIDILVYLLGQGADINAKNRKNNTPLHMATYRRHSDIVRYLVEHGADVNIRDEKGVTVLHKAAKFDRMDYVECLLQNGADVNVKDNTDSSALYYATYWNHSEIVERLVNKGADVNARNGEGLTALDIAMRFNRSNIAAYLLEHGADDDMMWYE